MLSNNVLLLEGLLGQVFVTLSEGGIVVPLNANFIGDFGRLWSNFLHSHLINFVASLDFRLESGSLLHLVHLLLGIVIREKG